MITKQIVYSQLHKIGLSFTFFGRAEVKELMHILDSDEIIYHCTYGWYQGGSGLLLATDRRMLLVDKRPFFLNLEDLRYEMITEVDFAGRLLDASLHLHTGSKKLSFRSLSDGRLRKTCRYVQDKITQARQMEKHPTHRTDVPEDEVNKSSWQPHSPLLPKLRPTKFTAYRQPLL